MFLSARKLYFKKANDLSVANHKNRIPKNAKMLHNITNKGVPWLVTESYGILYIGIKQFRLDETSMNLQVETF